MRRREIFKDKLSFLHILSRAIWATLNSSVFLFIPIILMINMPPFFVSKTFHYKIIISPVLDPAMTFLMFCFLILCNCPSFCLYTYKIPTSFHTHIMFVPGQFLLFLEDEFMYHSFSKISLTGCAYLPLPSAPTPNPKYTLLCFNSIHCFNCVLPFICIPFFTLYSNIFIRAYNRNGPFVNSVKVLALIIVLKLPISIPVSSTKV